MNLNRGKRGEWKKGKKGVGFFAKHKDEQAVSRETGTTRRGETVGRGFESRQPKKLGKPP